MHTRSLDLLKLTRLFKIISGHPRECLCGPYNGFPKLREMV